jgi:immediate early response 3-interacting protein 1
MLSVVGWSTVQRPKAPAGYNQGYDQTGYSAGQQDIGVKERLINLISAVRTLLRSTFVH